jgi:hypothetical protein
MRQEKFRVDQKLGSEHKNTKRYTYSNILSFLQPVVRKESKDAYYSNVFRIILELFYY